MLNFRQKFVIVFVFLLAGFFFGLALVYAVAPDDTLPRPKDLEYKASQLRDPFQSVLKEESAAEVKQVQARPLPALTVQGIIWKTNIPQAIINNKVVKTGDTVGEVKISNINKAGITVIFDGQEHLLASPAIANLESSKKKELPPKYLADPPNAEKGR